MRWHKWEDGLFPELERLDYDSVGLFHAIRACYWRTGEYPMSPEGCEELLGRTPLSASWPPVERLLSRLIEYLDSTRNPELRKKRSAAAKARWEKQAMQVHCKSDASALQVALQNQNQIEKQKHTPPTPPRGKPRSKATAAPEPSLEEILGGKGSKNWERYWKLAQLWPSEKNPAPKRAARTFLKAMVQMEGKEPAVYWAAQAYREKHEDPTGRDDRTRFMKMFETWLAEEGWQAEREVMREAETYTHGEQHV